MRKILILLLLSGCTNLSSYQPNLASTPINQKKYESDLADCVYKVKHPPLNLAYAFGLTGGIAAHATEDNAMYDDWLPPSKRVDACMTAKRYKLIN